MMQLNRFPIHFAYTCIFTFAIFLCIHPADTPITGRNHCLHWNVKNVICDRLQEQESTPWIFWNRNVERKKIPFQMILMVEYDTHIFYVSIQRQIIICVFCRSFWSHDFFEFCVYPVQEVVHLFSHKFIAFDNKKRKNHSLIRTHLGLEMFWQITVLPFQKKKETNVFVCSFSSFSFFSFEMKLLTQ